MHRPHTRGKPYKRYRSFCHELCGSLISLLPKLTCVLHALVYKIYAWLGRGRTTIKPLVVISIIAIRFVILPACGIGVVKAASELGFLPKSPLYHYVLLLQSTVPPAMRIGIPTYPSNFAVT
jgi:hypothetical protein